MSTIKSDLRRSLPNPPDYESSDLQTGSSRAGRQPGQQDDPSGSETSEPRRFQKFPKDALVRGAEGAFLSVVLGISAYLIHTTKVSLPEINLSLFVACFGVAFNVIYGIVEDFADFESYPLLTASMDMAESSMLLYAAGKLGKKLGVHNCTNETYRNTNEFCQGSMSRCRETQVVCIFLFLSYLCSSYALHYSTREVSQIGAFTKAISRRRARASRAERFSV